jgi:hypothetical protein
MSPRYVIDPKKPKIVPPKDWYTPPASPHGALQVPVSPEERLVGT